ncbi:MAG: dithiol-disulfide isomerase [bacterium]|nr:dithiol-disulfide isomerase [bacterium]
MSDQVKLTYFSDILCVWAYVSQIRLDELARQFGSRLVVDERFVPIFGNSATKIGKGWQERGGYAGYADHVAHVCDGFPHVTLDDRTWRETVPTSSGPSHLVVKATRLAGGDSSKPDDLAWRIRLAFFRDGVDVSSTERLLEIVEAAGLPANEVRKHVEDGSAMAAMLEDAELQNRWHIQGSPTYVLNEERQRLYGNLGYRVLEANVREVLERPDDVASWC